MNNYKKETKENKFDRKYWVDNKGKRTYFRFVKKYNNKIFRQKQKTELNKEI